MKHLGIFKGINHDKTFIIEHRWSNIVNNIPNAIPILPFRGVPDRKDSELTKLKTYLLYLAAQEQMLEKNQEYFRISKLKNAKSQDQGFSDVFTTSEQNIRIKKSSFNSQNDYSKLPEVVSPSSYKVKNRLDRPSVVRFNIKEE